MLTMAMSFPSPDNPHSKLLNDVPYPSLLWIQESTVKPLVACQKYPEPNRRSPTSQSPPLPFFQVCAFVFEGEAFMRCLFCASAKATSAAVQRQGQESPDACHSLVLALSVQFERRVCIRPFRLAKASNLLK